MLACGEKLLLMQYHSGIPRAVFLFGIVLTDKPGEAGAVQVYQRIWCTRRVAISTTLAMRAAPGNRNHRDGKKRPAFPV